jgi:hypothetical protein
MYKLGKLPAVKDTRTFKLKALLNPALPPPPNEYYFDAINGTILPTPMFGNDKYGDCVIAGRAHMTLRFEYFEQKTCLDITDGEILNQYWREGGWNGWWCTPKPDNGLVILNSLNDWRHNGWTTNKKLYTIYAFAAIDWKDFDEVKTSVSLLNGAYCGIALPKIAQYQNVWDFISFDGAENQPGSWGYHCVMIPDYNQIGPVCVTWGGKKQMTWAFMEKYFDECYAIVDNKDKWITDSPVDIEKLNSYLNML